MTLVTQSKVIPSEHLVTGETGALLSTLVNLLYSQYILKSKVSLSAKPQIIKHCRAGHTNMYYTICDWCTAVEIVILQRPDVYSIAWMTNKNGVFMRQSIFFKG